MSNTAAPSDSLARVELGDVLSLPDGRALSVRAKAVLPEPVGSMAGFALAGEFEVLVSQPPSPESPYLIYVAVSQLPAEASQTREVVRGATNYWAPHLPATRGAMGEIYYRVIEVRGKIDPFVVTYRGPEVVFFVRAAQAWGDEFRISCMRRSALNDVDVDRHAAVVGAHVDAEEVANVPSLFEVFTS